MTTTTTTNADSWATGCLLGALFMGAICLLGVIYNTNLADTEDTEDIGPCFMEYAHCGETSWAVLLYKQGPTLVDGIWACNLHKDGAQNSIGVVSRALTNEGHGRHYYKTVHVSDL